MPENLPPKVCLDGTLVRRTREGKKLTQLYVAKVVGVTTDTISRWENNRYPSIKKENALLLAEALDVDLAGILKKPEPDPPLLPQAPGRAFHPGLLLSTIALLMVLTALYLYFRRDNPAPTLAASRTLPVFAAPGSILPVRVRLAPGPETRGFILREHFPPGWKLLEASPPPSSLNNEEGTARWIIKPGEIRPLIAYLIRVTADAAPGQRGTFQGDVVANPDGRHAPTPVEGQRDIEISPFLWADLNGDQKIDDSEMLSASDTFDEMKGVHLDWSQLEDIWDAGAYRWDQKRQQFVPEHPRN